jgi:hypothetical protein
VVNVTTSTLAKGHRDRLAHTSMGVTINSTSNHPRQVCERPPQSCRGAAPCPRFSHASARQAVVWEVGR